MNIMANGKKSQFLRKAATNYYVLAGALLVVAANLAVSGIYFFNTYPVTEGWGINYVELTLRGKVPYRDFFYYLPPLNLAIETLFWKLSFGMLILFRGWYFAERILISLLVYRYLCRYFDWKTATTACVISSILSTADTYDLFGDYNQNIGLLAVLLAYAASNFAEAADPKKKKRQLFLAGIVLGCMFLCKQTIIVASAIIYIIALVVYCVIHKDKNFGWYIVAVATGSLIPIGIVLVYLAANQALVPFVQQVFMSADGKGSLIDIIIHNPAKRLFHKLQWAVALVFFGIVLFSKTKGEKQKNLYFGWMIAVVVLIVSANFDFKAYFHAVCSSPKYVALLVAAAVPSMVLLLFKKRLAHFERYFFVALTFWCVCFLFGTIGSKTVLSAIYRVFGLNSFHSSHGLFNLIILYCQLCWLAYWVVELCKGGEVEAFAMYSCGGLAHCYAYMMAGGGNIVSSYSLRITMPLMLCVIISGLSRNDVAKWLKNLLYLFCCVLVTLVCAQKAICAYNWWAESEKPMWEKTYSTDIPALRGITLSLENKEMYETIVKLVDENTDEDDLIFGWPYVKIFNVLCERYESNFVPVLWYDVAGDAYVEKTLYELQQDLPDMVIWKDVPTALSGHEIAFRGEEPLVQRRIVYFFHEVLPNDYILLDEIYGLKVYKLKDSAKVSNPSDEETLLDWSEQYAIPTNAEDAFAGGDGTEENPYRIETGEQLMAFEKLVNTGHSFDGQYILQTSDLDLDGHRFTAIGCKELETVFAGTYNGGNHVICNYTVRMPEEEIAEQQLTAEQGGKQEIGLFDQVDGTVYALELQAS